MKSPRTVGLRYNNLKPTTFKKRVAGFADTDRVIVSRVIREGSPLTGLVDGVGLEDEIKDYLRALLMVWAKSIVCHHQDVLLSLSLLSLSLVFFSSKVFEEERLTSHALAGPRVHHIGDDHFMRQRWHHTMLQSQHEEARQ